MIERGTNVIVDDFVPARVVELTSERALIQFRDGSRQMVGRGRIKEWKPTPSLSEQPSSSSPSPESAASAST